MTEEITLYHGTKASQISNIRKRGLRPFEESTGSRGKGIIFLVDSIPFALNKRWSDGTLVTVRVPRSSVTRYMKGVYISKNPIPSGQILSIRRPSFGELYKLRDWLSD